MDNPTLPHADLEQAILRIIKRKMTEGHALRLGVVSNSMEPLLRKGDTIEVREIPFSASELPKGLVVIFRIAGEFHVHRLVRSVAPNQELLCTKGDTSVQKDPPVPRSCVIGMLARRERAGAWEVIDSAKFKKWRAPSPKYQMRRAKKRLFDLLVTSIVHTSSFRIGRSLGTQLYNLSARSLPLIFQDASGTRSLYLKRSAAINEVEPGISDLDPLVVLATKNIDLYSAQNISWQRRVANLHRLAPHLGGLFVFSPAMFTFWARWGGIRASEMHEWRLLAGPEIRVSPHAEHGLSFQLSCLHELFSSYQFAYRELVKISLSPKLPNSIRLIRHLLDVNKYAFFASSPQLTSKSYSSSRASFVTLLPANNLKRACERLQTLLKSRIDLRIEEAIDLFRESAVAACATVIQCTELRTLSEAFLPAAIPSPLERLLGAEVQQRSDISSPAFDRALEEFFEVAEWAWYPPPFPSGLARSIRLLTSLSGYELPKAFAAERKNLQCAALAENLARFAACFRPQFSTQFLRLGLYFTAYRASKEQNGNIFAVTDLIASLSESDRPLVTSAISLLEDPQGLLGYDKMQAYGTFFTHVAHECIHVRESP